MAIKNIIGAVAVKVRPDTSGFRREAANKLKAETSGLHADVKLHPVIDNGETRREAREAQMVAQKALRDIDLKVHPAIDDFEVMRVREGLKRRLDDLKVKLQAEIDQNKLMREKRRAEALMYASNFEWEIKVGLVRRTYENVKRKLRKLEDTLKPKVKPKLSETAKLIAQARLMILARDRWVAFIPYVKKAAAAKVAATLQALAGFRILRKYLTKLKDWLSDLDRKILNIGMLTLGFMSLSGWVLTASANVLGFARNLGQMFQSSMALPGIIGGLVIGVGTFIAVVKDFNDVLPEVSDAIHDFQDEISARFWDRAKKPVKEMLDLLGPQFAKQIRKTTDHLASWSVKAANITKRVFDGKFGPMFSHLNKSIDIVRDHLGSVIELFELWGTIGSKYLPRLAHWVGKTADSFRDWTKENKESGRLFEMIDNGIEQWKEFWRLLANVGKFITELERQAQDAGAASFKGMADKMEGALNKIKTDRFRKNFIDALAAAHSMMSRISKQAGPAFTDFMERTAQVLSVSFRRAGDAVGSALKTIFSALANTSVGAGFISMIDGFAAGLKGLEPLAKPLGNALGDLLTVIGNLARNFGPLATSVFTPLFEIVSALAPAVNEFVNAIGPPLTELFTELAKVIHDNQGAITTLASAFAGTLAEGINAVVKILSTVVKLLGMLPKPVTSAATTIGSLALAFVGLRKGVARFGLSGFIGKLGKAGLGVGLLSRAFKLIPFAGVVAGFSKLAFRLSGMSLLFSGLGRGLDKLPARFSGLTSSFGQLSGKAKLLRGGLGVAGAGLLMLGTKLKSTDSKAGKTAGVLSDTLGGALVGLSLGGPIGAAIGGVAGLAKGLLGLKGKSEDAKKSLSNWDKVKNAAAEGAKSVADAIDASAGKLDEAVRKTAAARLYDAGFAQDAQRLGIEFSTMVDAALGNANAMGTLKKRVEEYVNGLDNPKEVRAAIKHFKEMGINIDEIADKTHGAVKRSETISEGVKSSWSKLPKDIRKGMKPFKPFLDRVSQMQDALGRPNKLNLDMSEAKVAEGKMKKFGLTLDDLKRMKIKPKVFMDMTDAEIKAAMTRDTLDELSTLKGIPGVDLDNSKFNLKSSKIGPTLAKNIKKAKKSGKNSMSSVMSGIVATVNDAVGKAGKAGKNVGEGTAKGVKGTKTTNAKAAAEATQAAIRSILGKRSSATSAGKGIGNSAASGVSSSKGRSSSAGRRNAQAAVSAIRGKFSGMFSAGSYLMGGLRDGISSKGQAAIAAASSIASTVVSLTRGIFGVRSPSRVFREIGEFVGEGLVLGIESMQGSVVKASERMSRAAVDNGTAVMTQVYNEADARVAQAEAMTRSIENKGHKLTKPNIDAMVSTVEASLSTEGPVVKQLIYNAAPASAPISDQDQLFKAADRSRMVF